MIEYYRDFKAKQSTKMIGESLEQHCSSEFNKIRTLFENCTFEKDNDIRTGSKGDFIFRCYTDSSKTSELVSIMFEMKNEADVTSTKHKNEHFFKELDKDRKEKNCEYAVLVSLLETDNDYYNNGIVDVSYEYEKMYVIRPQFFIPIITLITSLSRKSIDYKKELDLVKEQNIDITNFRDNLFGFQQSFGKSFKYAKDRYDEAIDQIDKIKNALDKVKQNLITSKNHLDSSNNKLQELSVDKLTKGNPTMKQMFSELDNQLVSDSKEGSKKTTKKIIDSEKKSKDAIIIKDEEEFDLLDIKEDKKKNKADIDLLDF